MAQDPFKAVMGSRHGGGRKEEPKRAHLWDGLDHIGTVPDARLEAWRNLGGSYMVMVGPVDEERVPQGFGEHDEEALQSAREVVERLREACDEDELSGSGFYTGALYERGAQADDVEALEHAGHHWSLVLYLPLDRAALAACQDDIRALSEQARDAGLVVEHGINAP
jgi:hypothetical protein